MGICLRKPTLGRNEYVFPIIVITLTSVVYESRLQIMHISINNQMDTDNVVYPRRGILYSSKDQWNTSI